MNGIVSGLAGVLFALAAGLLLGGETRIRQHVDELSKQAYTAGWTSEEEALVDKLLPTRVFTTELLATRDDALSVAGVVYDVSGSKSLYGESGWYNYFVGKDATYVFGTGTRIGYSFDDHLEGQDPSDTSKATPKQLRLICHYVKRFRSKYRKIGILAPSVFYTAGGVPTTTRGALMDACTKTKLLAHSDPHEGADDAAANQPDDEEVLFETEASHGHDGSERPTKCPVIKTARAAKKVAKAAADFVQKLLPHS